MSVSKTFYFMVKWKDDVWVAISRPGLNDTNDWQFVDQINLESDSFGNIDITSLIVEYNRLKKFKKDCEIKLILIGGRKPKKTCAEIVNDDHAMGVGVLHERKDGRCCPDK